MGNNPGKDYTMEITIYAKKRTTAEGKSFWSYLSRLTRKDGAELTVSVRFRESAGNPKPEECPMNIVIEPGYANLSTRKYTREDTGELAESYTLWVTDWEPGIPFVDHSLDDFA